MYQTKYKYTHHYMHQTRYTAPRNHPTLHTEAPIRSSPNIYIYILYIIPLKILFNHIIMRACRAAHGSGEGVPQTCMHARARASVRERVRSCSARTATPPNNDIISTISLLMLLCSIIKTLIMLIT